MLHLKVPSIFDYNTTQTRGQNDGTQRTSHAADTLLQPQTHDSDQSRHLIKHISITRVSLPTIEDKIICDPSLKYI